MRKLIEGFVEVMSATERRILARIEPLEKRQPEPPANIAEIARQAAYLIPPPVNGKDGRDGQDATAADVEAIAAKAAALLPVPKDGRDGKDASAVDVDAIALQVAELIPPPDLNQLAAKAAALIPAPKDGRDGVSVDVAQVDTLVAARVKDAVSAIPVPKDGKDGKDGVWITGALVDQNGNLQLMRSDGSVQDCGRVVGAVGKDGRDGIDAKGIDGKDGADGLGFDDFEEEIEDGGRILVHRWRRGDRVKEFRHKLATMIYRGVFLPGKEYERGDVVTSGGSIWHGNETTTMTKPGDGSKAWTLAAKKGSDGRDGKAPETSPVVRLERSHA